MNPEEQDKLGAFLIGFGYAIFLFIILLWNLYLKRKRKK
jgi:hypothetical protein